MSGLTEEQFLALEQMILQAVGAMAKPSATNAYLYDEARKIAKAALTSNSGEV